MRLLRVLQECEYKRLGGRRTVKTDVRVIAATNVDLEKAISAGEFRRDLFFRLSVFPIVLPTLRERREDIPLLVTHFLETYKKKSGRYISGISRAALAAFSAHDWPGNIRELENAIERAVIIASGRRIELEDLPESISSATGDGSYQKTTGSRISFVLPATLPEVERELIEATLEMTAGDKTAAARALDIGRKTLYRRLEEYDEEAANS